MDLDTELKRYIDGVVRQEVSSLLHNQKTTAHTAIETHEAVFGTNREGGLAYKVNVMWEDRQARKLIGDDYIDTTYKLRTLWDEREDRQEVIKNILSSMIVKIIVGLTIIGLAAGLILRIVLEK